MTEQTPGALECEKCDHLSVSGLCAFRRCPRKYFYEHVAELSPHVVEEPNYFTYGRAIHAAAPSLLLSEQEGGGMDDAVSRFDAIWDDEFADDKRNRNNAMGMLRNFASNHSGGRAIYTLVKPPQTGIINPDKLSPWEVPFALDIGLPNSVLFVGLIDSVVRHRDTKKLWGVEVKTSSEMSTRFMNAWSMNPQCIGYSLALSSYEEEPIAGVYVEGLLVAKKSVNNLCIPVEVKPFLYEDFINLMKLTYAEIDACENSGIWPKDLSGCNPYAQFGSHGYTCDFEALCSVPDWRMMRNLFGTRKARKFVLAGGKEIEGGE